MIINARNFARAQGSARTWTDVYNDGNTKGDYIADTSNLTLSGTNVTAWADETANGYNLTNGTASEQPLWDAANSEVDFNPDAGTDDNLQRSSVTINQPFTFYVVFRTNVRAGLRVLYFNTATYFSTNNTGDNYLWLYAGTGLTDNHASVGSYQIVTGIYNGASSSLQVNEQAVSTGNAGTNAGAVIRMGAGSNSEQFSIKRLIVRDGADSDADKLLMIRYLNSLYSVY